MLLDEDDYIQLTGDEDTATVLVTAALLEAQEMIEEELQRPLELAEYTEELPVLRNGRAYPSATPLVSVASDVNYVVADDTSLYFGWGRDPVINWGGAEWGDFDDSLVSLDYPTPRFDFTYVGGYAPDALPHVLRRAIIRLAAALIRERDPARQAIANQLPQGVSSVSVGDVSITRVVEDKAIDLLVPGLSKNIVKYRKRDVG